MDIDKLNEEYFKAMIAQGEEVIASLPPFHSETYEASDGNRYELHIRNDDGCVVSFVEIEPEVEQSGKYTAVASSKSKDHGINGVARHKDIEKLEKQVEKLENHINKLASSRIRIHMTDELIEMWQGKTLILSGDGKLEIKDK